MQCYPQRLSATSWNLAESPAHVVGFSGTNDNHRLLPCQVKQYFGDTKASDSIWQSLRGTNGRMLEIILQRTTKCLSLSGCNRVASILEMLQDDPDLHNVQAIIDAGALLAGHSNEAVARKMMAAFGSIGVSKFKGIVFFDNSSLGGQWMALEPSGRLLPKNQSPVQESEAFAIFDEPHCPGSNLKLNKTAAALLTIGSSMCKSTLMQAAGRMRSLDQGQSLVISGTEFLLDEILETRDSQHATPQVILEWTLRNTVKANAEGLLPWADQGLFFSTSQGKPEHSVEDEMLSLDDYYGGAFHDVSISCAVESARTYHTGRISGDSSMIGPKEEALMEEICNKAQRYGENMVHACCGMDEECERELELEREIEEEKEVEIPRMIPLTESDWDKSRVLEATSPSILTCIVDITSLGDFIATKLQPCGISRFAWSRDVFGTSNFFNAVASQSGLPLSSFDHYLRMVDVFLTFPNKQVLLISEREADELIKLLWRHTGKRTVSLSHLSLLRSALDYSIPGLLLNSMVLGQKWSSSQLWLRGSNSNQRKSHSDCIIATMQLFAGETSYKKITPRSSQGNSSRAWIFPRPSGGRPSTYRRRPRQQPPAPEQ